MFAIIALLSIISLIATDIYAPSLPAIAHVFNQSINHTELTLSLFLAGFALSQLFYGPISDRVGRKQPIIWGIMLFILGTCFCLFANSFFMFCFGRIVQGLGIGGGLSLARVVLRDCYHGTKLAIKSSQVGFFVCLTPAIAPYIGGLLQGEFGYRSVFVFLLGYGLILLALVSTCFKETLQSKHTDLTVSHTIKLYAKLMHNFQFIRYVLMAGISFSSIIIYANLLPFIIQNQLHMSAKQNGEVLLFAASGLCFASLLSSRIVHLIGSKKLISVSLCILALSGIALIFCEYLFGTRLIPLLLILFLVTFSCGFIFPNALAVAFSQIDVNIGIAGAVYGFIQISSSTLCNFILNLIPDQNQALLGSFYLALGIFGIIMIKTENAVKCNLTNPVIVSAE